MTFVAKRNWVLLLKEHIGRQKCNTEIGTKAISMLIPACNLKLCVK